MKILIVEDDPNKGKQLQRFVREHYPTAELEDRHSYQSGLKAILQWSPDIILLDMTMPTYDVSPREKGGKTRFYAGREILGEITRKKLTSKVIVVTQFESFGEADNAKTLDQLRSELAGSFVDNYFGIVFYQAAVSGWRDALLAAMRKAVRSAGGDEK